MSPTDLSKDSIRHLYTELWNQGNVKLADDLLADDFVHRGNIAPDSLEGSTGYKEFVREILHGFPDTSVEIVTVIGEGEWVAARWVAHGTHSGEYLGIEPTDKRVSTSGVSFASIVEGKVVELWDLYDTDALLRQLGRR